MDEMSSTPTPDSTRVVFLLGKRDIPADVIQDYCEYLGQALGRRGIETEIARFEWDLPSEKAMACGLPVIVSSTNGTSEIITNKEDGLILADPTDASPLSVMVQRLYEDSEFRVRLGANAAETARRYTWEQNGREVTGIFREVIRRKARTVTQSVASEL